MNQFIESWDYCDATSQRFYITGSETPTTISGGRRGTRACAATTENGWGGYLVSGFGNTLIAGVAVAFPTASGLGNILAIGDPTASGYANITLRAFDDGSLGVYRTPEVLLALAPAGTLALGGAYQYIEAKVTLDAGSAGVVEVRVNGQPVITLNAAQTYYAGSLTPTLVTLYPQGRRYYDDLYINTTNGDFNTDFEGDVRIDTHYVVADGTVQWNRLSGSTNFGMVNEHPPDDDVTYNSTPTNGAIDLLDLEDLIPALAGVRAVHFLVRAKAINLPLVSGTMHSLLRMNAVNYLGASYQVSTSGYRYFNTIWEASPATLVAFTDEEFNDMQVGYKFG